MRIERLTPGISEGHIVELTHTSDHHEVARSELKIQPNEG